MSDRIRIESFDCCSIHSYIVNTRNINNNTAKYFELITILFELVKQTINQIQLIFFSYFKFPWY
jgi:hypothetical protein